MLIDKHSPLLRNILYRVQVKWWHFRERAVAALAWVYILGSTFYVSVRALRRARRSNPRSDSAVNYEKCLE